MAFISTISDDEAEGPPAEMYARDRAQMGYVANYTRALAHRPAVFEAWRQLNTSIRGGMDLRRYELATLAAARRPRQGARRPVRGSRDDAEDRRGPQVG